ncbi:MAG: glycerol-3-phosphate 1-O-acyltransferase PlsY [Lachnospiraceae bacterium]|nr:glycerol-3-phosphate 1-O-acyltransferase PlsY [Lachnospiraceae bacterium]
MERVICLVVGYVFGLFQTAYFYGKAHGIDIRQHGSGNSGTTNALRVLGTKAGLIVFAGDCLKCILAIVLTKLVFGTSHTLVFGTNHTEAVYLLAIYTAAGVILGHNFPFYMNFKGGKGIAATAGLVLAFHPYFIPMGVILFFGAFLTTHYVSLGSLLVYAGLLIEMIVCGQLGVFTGMTQGQLIELYLVTFILTVMAFWKHRANIVRLIKGEERKTYLFKKNKLEDGSGRETDRAEK